MNQSEFKELLDELRSLPHETEWVEFKVNNEKPDEIGEYISALSNAACCFDKEKGYLVFGIEDQTHKVVGTKLKPKQKRVGNQELEIWLATLLSPRINFIIHEFEYENRPVVIIEIDAAINRPIRFKGVDFIRIGSSKCKLADFPEKERIIWNKQTDYDWSAQICKNATLDDLDKEAILKARTEYKQKNTNLATEVDTWDDLTFLKKAKIAKGGEITTAALILLGKPESSTLLSPAVAQISWVLKDNNNETLDSEQFFPPFLLTVDRILRRIRNLKYQYLPNNTLFPIEITQYDTWVIREVLHNCIAHQDYGKRARIKITERPDELIFENSGDFFVGLSVEEVIKLNQPPAKYRNTFLTIAMVNLRMIETLGGGIRNMFLKQKERFFPMPDYDLTQSDLVKVRIAGKVLDENFTRLLMGKKDLDLSTVILLDKVQKKVKISKKDHKLLKSQNLVEGRYPNIFVASSLAQITGERVQYVKNKGLDKESIQEWIIKLLKAGAASRKDMDELLLNKLPDILTERQKKSKISYLLAEMSRKQNLIENQGSNRKPVWVLKESKDRSK